MFQINITSHFQKWLVFNIIPSATVLALFLHKMKCTAVQLAIQKKQQSVNPYMNPQNITATGRNSNHLGQSENDSEKSAAQKNRATPPGKSTLLNTSEKLSSNNPVNHQKTGSKSNTAAESHPAALHEPTNETVFRLDAPAAHTVLLAGDFSNWEKAPIKMIKGGGGVWHAKVLLAPGRHQYRFLVDGAWQNDPSHQAQVSNAFGSFNNVVEVH